MALVPWRHEPDPYRRNKSELPWLPTLEKSNAGTWEALLQNARGRYLQLRLTLLGNGRATPRITALRAYYPRFSWLEHYLPAAWRRDPVSAAFVERWLANPEGVFTALEDRLAAVHCLFDARSVPVAMLDWLGSWFRAGADRRLVRAAQAPAAASRRPDLPRAQHAGRLDARPAPRRRSRRGA